LHNKSTAPANTADSPGVVPVVAGMPAEADDVNHGSGRPASSQQVYEALGALGAAPLLDPQLRPDGPLPEYRLPLLGALLATTELEITTALDGDDRQSALGRVALGWDESIDRDPPSALGVLVARMDNTSLQIASLDVAGVGHITAWAAARMTSDLLRALLSLQLGDRSRAVMALEAAEESARNVVAGIREARAATGEDEG